ncbi:MAG: flagellar biosynthetic protein FliO [Acidobacteriaceae bacterium]|jgi:hypothetical protein
MIVKIRIPRPFFPGLQAGPATLAAALPSGASFHATLTGCAEDWVVQQSPRAATLPTRAITRQLQRPAPGMLRRAWSWLHGKYALTGAKRLRVAESVSLGEKRFVALIRVEDCEFLIGGGASGVSLLTQLGDVPAAANARRSGLGVEGDSQ